jgi:hypothetical protein
MVQILVNMHYFSAFFPIFCLSYQKRPSIKHTEGKYIILIKRYGKLLRCSLKNPALNKAEADACGAQL